MLLASCASSRVPVNSKLASVPAFSAAPIKGACKLGDVEADCVLILRVDYDALFNQARAMCHALGGTDTNCQWP